MLFGQEKWIDTLNRSIQQHWSLNIQQHRIYYKNAIGVVPTQAKANQINNVNLVARKSTKFQQADRKTKNTQSVYASTLSVKHGIHTASRVIRKRFGTRRLGLQKAALRKLVKLNRANAVRRRNEIAATKAQKK